MCWNQAKTAPLYLTEYIECAKYNSALDAQPGLQFVTEPSSACLFKANYSYQEWERALFHGSELRQENDRIPGGNFYVNSESFHNYCHLIL